MIDQPEIDEDDAFAFPPATSGMPTLEADYTPHLLLRYSAAAAFEGPGWMSYEEHWLTVSLARLTDKAIREYNAARHDLETFVAGRAESEGRRDPIHARGLMPNEALAALLTSADHLENCIDTLRRADLFTRTTTFQSAISASGHTYPPPYIEELHNGVRLLRNRIEHADEDLEEGLIPAGEPLFTAPGAHGVSFSGRRILYAELAALIVTLWHLVDLVIEPSDDTVHTPVHTSDEEQAD